VAKVFIYRDKEGASRIWQDNFLVASKVMGLQVIEIPFDGLFERPNAPRGILKKIHKNYQKGDVFVARFNERKEHLIKRVYPELQQIFGENMIFPDKRAEYFYNNKERQAEFFNRTDYPTPVQQWVQSRDELNAFMQQHALSFPVVRKESHGAGSAGVSLIDTGNTTYPFVAQEFCMKNEGDIRIMVIGDRIFGFARKNRKNDFRASGSGMIEYIEELPMECVKLAYQVSHECGFVCMAYDFIKNNSGKHVIAEISYTFVSEPASRCPYYYSAADQFARKQITVGSVERLILEQLVSPMK
jgi:hypothetical protein